MSFISVASGVCLGMFFFAILSSPYGPFGSLKRDDTDPKHGRPSGLIVYTDNKTGVQYVGTIGGGITVRVDADGKPLKGE